MRRSVSKTQAPLIAAWYQRRTWAEFVPRTPAALLRWIESAENAGDFSAADFRRAKSSAYTQRHYRKHGRPQPAPAPAVEPPVDTWTDAEWLEAMALVRTIGAYGHFDTVGGVRVYASFSDEDDWRADIGAVMDHHVENATLIGVGRNSSYREPKVHRGESSSLLAALREIATDPEGCYMRARARQLAVKPYVRANGHHVMPTYQQSWHRRHLPSLPVIFSEAAYDAELAIEASESEGAKLLGIERATDYQTP
jgi:hypothetical protein